jgi:hypothetical protein
MKRMDKRRAFLQILWGVLFVAVDVNVSFFSAVFDVVPDLIGFLLIVFALQLLEAEDVNFRTVRIYAILGAVTSVLLILPFLPAELRQLVGMMQTLWEVLIVWYLCTGIMRLAEVRGDARLSGFAAANRVLYIGMAMINVGVRAVVLIFSVHVPAIIVVILVALNLIIAFLVMLLLWQAAAELAPTSS